MEQEQKIRISVRDLVEFILRSGDIDNRRGGPGDREAMQEGSRIHRKIQSRMGGGYQAEVPLSAELPGEGYTLVVEGRADGIFREEDTVYIDEIKGMYRDVAALENPLELHLAQAKCYGYLYGRREALEEIGIQMTYCNLETEEIRRFRQLCSMEELAEWFGLLTDAYHRWAAFSVEWKGIRQASIRGLTFPFPWRQGQKEAASAVYRTILRKKILFLQASTGTGKTMSTVFPAVKAVGEGLADRIFYGTAKTITRTVAEEAYGILRTRGLRMKTVTLTAKEKICFCETAECNPEACPYARGHYDRVNDAVFELITSGEVFDRRTLEEQARRRQVCPFELGLDVSLWCDAVICDYNYIFDPRAKLRRFFGEGVKGDYLFLIDEAHNLVERGREMFSATLYKEDFLALKREAAPAGRKLIRALNRCNTWLLEKKRECETVRIQEDLGIFPVYLMNLCGVMEEALEEPRHGELNKKILELYFAVRHFLDTCDRLSEKYLTYTELDGEGRFLIRLFCVDVSENLQECLSKGRSTIYFSATFLPVGYYKSLLSTEKDNYAIYARSSFDPGRQAVMIGTDTTSRYASRTPEEYRKIADYVLQVIQARRGNYMIFFSSYRMMEETAKQFRLLAAARGEEIELLCQSAGMSESQREEYLARFEERHPGGMAGFCVMGGIFSEGIDLREDRLIGAVIVGTGLPQVCRERELLKYYYDRQGEDGFFYAYLCPGMNKVLQAAGRVIRTEQDTGLILLLDNRFASSRYRRMFPEEWEQTGCCTLGDVRQKAEAFWESHRP